MTSGAGKGALAGALIGHVRQVRQWCNEIPRWSADRIIAQAPQQKKQPFADHIVKIDRQHMQTVERIGLIGLIRLIKQRQAARRPLGAGEVCLLFKHRRCALKITPSALAKARELHKRAERTTSQATEWSAFIRRR